MRLPTLALLAAMVAGCSRAPAPIPQSPPSSEAQTDARPVAASSETASSAPALYRLPASEGEPPAWWLPPAARVVMPYSLSRTVELAAAGGSRAILSSLGGLLVVDAKSGVVGTRAIDSQVEWLALDERDGLVAAREDGSLWRAPTWDAAMSPVGRVPGALRWDLAAGSIVAATSAGVMRSTDDGKSFASLPDLPRPVTHIEVFTRSDGVVVVQGKSDDGTLAAFSLRRRDRRWTAAPADVGQLERSGDWIADDGPSSCANVLSRDGIHWVETKDDREFDYWESLTSLDDEVQYGPTGPFITLGVPAAPSRRVPPCDDPGGVGGLGMSGVGGDGDEPLRGTTGPRPRPTTRWAQLFSDALSSGIDDDEPWVRPPSSQITRRPHVALWNEAGRTLRSVELPAACTHPLTIHDAAGAGVLRCEQPKSIALWTIGADGVWHAEGTLPVDREPPGTLTVADDGTMMLHGQCALNGPCDTSWLRVPKALGGSWRALPGGDTLAYRVLAGGRALQISGTVAMGYMLAVVDGEHDPLPVGKVEHDGRTLERLTIAADRTVRLRFTAKEGDPVEYALDPAIAVIDAPTTPPPADPILRPHGASGKVTAFGDYDGDGFDDLAIVRRNTDSYKGRVVIVRGMPTFGSQDDTQLQAEPNIEIGLDVRFYYVEYLGSAGDFNGDGYADLLISLVIPGPADELTAEAYVVWGRSTTEPRSLSAIRAGDGGVWIGGVPSWSRYQLKTRMIGDIDGDGRTDIGLSLAGAEDGRGLLYIVRGKTDAAWIHLGDVARDLGGYVLRGQPNENLGQGFAAIGDLDGDGGQDLAVAGTVDDHARIYVVRGGANQPHVSGDAAARSGLVIDTTTDPAVPARAGDFDGDGLADLAIAERYHRGGDFRSGRVTIVYGRRTPGPLDLADDSADVIAIDGAFAFDELGHAVAAIGDHDGDGYDDLAIGAASATRNGVTQGLIHLVRGSQTHADIRLANDADGRSLDVAPLPGVREWGTAVVSAGDVDGDGGPDFLVAGARIESDEITPIQLILHRSP